MGGEVEKPSLAYGLTHHTTPLQRYEVDETWRDDTHTLTHNSTAAGIKAYKESFLSQNCKGFFLLIFHPGRPLGLTLSKTSKPNT